MNGFEIKQIVVADVDADTKVEASVPPVDDLVVSELDEIRVLGVSDGDQGVDFFDQFLLLLRLETVVPFRQSGFSRSILDQDEFDRHLGRLNNLRFNKKNSLTQMSYFSSAASSRD